MPSSRTRETGWLLRNADAKPAELTAEERAYVEALGSKSPKLARARRLTTEFVAMLEHNGANALEPWLAAAGKSALRALAVGIRRDYDAVLAALLFQRSNGQVEGQVKRVKLVKRRMSGRAGFASACCALHDRHCWRAEGGDSTSPTSTQNRIWVFVYSSSSSPVHLARQAHQRVTGPQDKADTS